MKKRFPILRTSIITVVGVLALIYQYSDADSTFFTDDVFTGFYH